MPRINPARLAADCNGSIVVFVIGMRINRFHRPDKWWPVAQAMGPMIAELAADPDSGFLGWEGAISGLRTIFLVQYWRDFDALEAYARARERKHWPAWTRFNKAVGTDGSVGIFHETYVVGSGAAESVYVNMPAWGLAKARGLVPATGSRNEARSRMKAAGDE